MISATVLTKNSEPTLRATLESLRSFPEVLVYDTGSSDKTLAIAGTFPNVRIVNGVFTGFGPTHNTASALASHDWILSIDSDEILSSELVEEIRNLKLDASAVYQLQRHNFFNGKWIRWCGGWYPDPVIRLYHRKQTRFTEDAVHEKILSVGLRVIPLSSPLLHTPYRSIDDLLAKMQLYSTLFAEQNRFKKQSNLFKALIHGHAAFFKSYFLKRGFLGGAEGLIISLYNGHTAFYKYLKLYTRSLRKDLFQ
jgi:glycosyltransferase involved in cell wall biosynthesis